MRRPAALAAALGLLLAGGPAVHAAGNPGTTALRILRTPFGPRPVGMGGAFTAVDDDVYAGWYNPANLGTIRRLELGAMLSKGLDDHAYQHLAAAFPLPWGFITEDQPVVVGASALFSESGDITVNRTGSDGSFLSSETLAAGKDIVASLTFAQRAFDEVYRKGGRTHVREHHIGLTGKYIRSTLVESFTADAWAVDIGYLFKIPEWGLGAGVSALNLGPGVKYLEKTDPLPISYRGGVSWTQRLKNNGALTFAGDGEHFTQERESKGAFGMEYIYDGFIAFRLGYRFAEDGGGGSAGFGLRRGSLAIDYGWMNTTLGGTHRISMKVLLDVPWRLDSPKNMLRWEEVLEAPSLPKLEKAPVKGGRDQDNNDPLPVLPGWMR